MYFIPDNSVVVMRRPFILKNFIFLQNPDLVTLELRNAQTAIAMAHSKLRTYLKTIRSHLPKQTSVEVSNALDGIEDVCQFLDVKFMFPLHSRPGPIDQALEANEQQLRNQKQKTETPKKSLNTDLNPLFNGKESHCTVQDLRVEHENAGSYERPDIGFMVHSKLLLGNTKEIELTTIVSDEKVEGSQLATRSKTNSGLPVADPTNSNS